MFMKEAKKLIKAAHGHTALKKAKILYDIEELDRNYMLLSDAQKLLKNAKYSITRTKYNTKLNNEERWQITITPQDILDIYEEQGGLDYWTKTQLKPAYIKISNHRLAPSLDRLNGKIGYTKANCVLTARCVNLARGSLTVKEFAEQLPLVIHHFTNLPMKPHGVGVWQINETPL